MKIMFTVAPPTAPSTGNALAADRSVTTTPKRVAISLTRLLTTGAETFAVPRSSRIDVAFAASRLISVREA